MKLYFVFLTVRVSLVLGVSGTDEVPVSVMEGDSVTFHTGVQTSQQDKIKWYFNDIRIAEINRDRSKTCTDVQCNEYTERFRDRLKLDHQTGSLTITNIRNTHSGLYHLEVISSNITEKIFRVSIRGVSAVETDEVKIKSVKEGEYVTLGTGVTIIDRNDLMMWYFYGSRIAYISGGPVIWRSPQRFSDRLKLDHQTGSLNITNTRNTDSGEYKLEITNSSRQHSYSICSNSVKRFSVTVNVPGLSSFAVGGIGCRVVLLLIVAAVICCCCRT